VSEAPGASEVHWSIEGTPSLADEAVLEAVHAALRHGQRPCCGLSVVFVSDPVLAEMHEAHLGDPTLTDVISFDLGEDEDGPAGELYVSVDRARVVAAERGVAFERELLLYIVHGALHLCGYDDHEDVDRERMRAAERSVMQELGYAPDDAPHDSDPRETHSPVEGS